MGVMLGCVTQQQSDFVKRHDGIAKTNHRDKQ
jgi:hypothetical protein